LKEQNQHNEYFLADWLSGQMSDAELRALVGDDAFETYLKIRQATAVLPAMSKPIKPVWEQIEAKINDEPKSKTYPLFISIKKILPYAAILLLMLGVYQFFDISQIVVQTADNQQKTVWLPDGSQVVLHQNSTLKYTAENWKEESKIFIEGNVFVKNCNAKNLDVYTQQGRIAISNATIELFTDKAFLKILTYKGNVDIYINDELTKLNQNTEFIYKNEHRKLTPIKRKSPVWLTNISTFNAMPLGNVLDRLEHFYHVKIDRSSVDTKKLFSGKVPKYDLPLALITVLKPMQIDYKVVGTEIELVKRKSD